MEWDKQEWGAEGGFINSKSEYSKCHLPCLQLEDKATREQRAREAQIRILIAELSKKSVKNIKQGVRKTREDDIQAEGDDQNQGRKKLRYTKASEKWGGEKKFRNTLK